MSDDRSYLLSGHRVVGMCDHFGPIEYVGPEPLTLGLPFGRDVVMADLRLCPDHHGALVDRVMLGVSIDQHPAQPTEPT